MFASFLCISLELMCWLLTFSSVYLCVYWWTKFGALNSVQPFACSFQLHSVVWTPLSFVCVCSAVSFRFTSHQFSCARRVRGFRALRYSQYLLLAFLVTVGRKVSPVVGLFGSGIPYASWIPTMFIGLAGTLCDIVLVWDYEITLCSTASKQTNSHIIQSVLCSGKSS